MKSFQFYTPTKVIFGQGVEQNIGREVKAFGGTKVLIVHGTRNIDPLIKVVQDSLKAEQIESIVLGGVVPNPLLSLVRKGIDLVLKEKVDFLIAIGGGSVIDSVKSIAVGAAVPEVDIWDYCIRKATCTAALPLGVVLTIPAAGSEMSNSIVLTRDEDKLKRGFNSDIFRPKFAMMNPDNVKTLPTYQRGAGVADIMMHTLERYFSKVLGNQLSDRIAESVFSVLLKYGEEFVYEPENEQACSEVLWAGSVSHNDITGLGGIGDWGTHGMGHELSAKFDATHGATLAALWGSVCRKLIDKGYVNRFIEYAINVFGCEFDTENPVNTAYAGIELTEQFFSSIGMPISIPQLLGSAATDEELVALRDKLFIGKTAVGATCQFNEEEALEVYRNANQ